MAKQAHMDIPGLTGTAARTARQVIRLLEHSQSMTHQHCAQHLSQALDIWLAALDQVPMGPWVDTCVGMEKGMAPLAEALGLLALEAASSFQDILGAVYMYLSQGEKRLGQFFTPYSAAMMMAQMSCHNLTPPEPEAPPLRILEPCCGSGTLLLTAAKTIEAQHPGMIQQGKIRFFGMDLDPICVKMCRLNMYLHFIGLLSTLERNEPERKGQLMFQPACIVRGNALDKESARLFEHAPPWIPIARWPISVLAHSPMPHSSPVDEHAHRAEERESTQPEQETDLSQHTSHQNESVTQRTGERQEEKTVTPSRVQPTRRNKTGDIQLSLF